MIETQWPYLLKPEFAYRHAIAAEALKDCDLVVEIGPGCTGMSDRLTAGYFPIELLDGLDAMQVTIADIPACERLGVVALGLQQPYPLLTELASRAAVMVLESARDWTAGHDALRAVVGDWPDTFFEVDFYLGRGPYRVRHLVILTR
jgi:hypothetical protein